MRHSHQIAERERDDRLSSLGDVVLGHVLSFLDAKEIALAAALSRRWHDVLAIVHTVSLGLEQPNVNGPSSPTRSTAGTGRTHRRRGP